jgi:lipoprotein-releasing system ATP-binding protein
VLFRSFAAPGGDLEILKDINLTVDEGATLAIVGASGSGKSTLLHLMGALDSPTTGAVYFHGEDMARMNPDQKAAFRNRTLGFVFQFHHLLPEFSALENVAMPAIIGGRPRSEVLPQARAMLERVAWLRAWKAKSPPSPAANGSACPGPRCVAAPARAAGRRTHRQPGRNHRGAGGIPYERTQPRTGMTLVVVTHNRNWPRVWAESWN